jgi:hypothetical protein
MLGLMLAAILMPQPLKATPQPQGGTGDIGKSIFQDLVKNPSHYIMIIDKAKNHIEQQLLTGLNAKIIFPITLCITNIRKVSIRARNQCQRKCDQGYQKTFY